MSTTPRSKALVFECDNEGWSGSEEGYEYLNLFLTNLSKTRLWKQLEKIADERWEVTIKPRPRRKEKR